jgi:pyruvate ferredoxin oxidoreductase beta subunit
MSTIKELARNRGEAPPLRGGHALCAGCGIPIVVRTVLGSIDGPVVVVSATGCLEVATTRFPTTAWTVPWLHVTFENAAAVASGVESAHRALVRRGRLPDEPVTFVVFAGDGGTYDIGLQALSGALERGHRFLYVCYDNQAYMNTGVQRSSATPRWASTTTSPASVRGLGKLQERKDITAIAAAHHVPYVAQAAGCHWQDLARKVRRATSAGGPAFVNALADCPLGWRHPARIGPRVARLAVETRLWPLYEVAEGRTRLTYEPAERVPVQDWLALQGRFAHLLTPEHADAVAAIQARVDADWDALLARCAADAALRRAAVGDYDSGHA